MIKNKKASHDYFFIETETVGIMLRGSEMRAVRNDDASIVESFIFIDKEKEEVWIKNMNIIF